MKISAWFRALIKDPKIKSKADFRLVARVMDANGLTLHELMGREPDEIARLLFLCDCRTARQVANRLPRRINELAVLFPNEDLPISDVPACSDQRLCRLADEPKQLQTDIQQLREKQAERARKNDIIDLIATMSHEIHIRSVREHLAALRRKGMPVSDSIGVRTLMHSVRFSVGLKQLEAERLAKSTIYKIGLGTIYIATDLYSDDPLIPLMRAELRGRAPSHEIPPERSMSLVEMLAKDGAQRMLEAPGQIAERAKAGHLTEIARRSRLAMAAAWDLKLNHPRLRPVQVAGLHLDDSFDREGEAWFFKSPSHRGSRTLIREPMEQSTVGLLLQFEAQFGSSTRLIFPSRKGGPRHFNLILMQMYQEFELVSGLRLDFMTIKDLHSAAGCWDEQEEALIRTSQGLGYKCSQSLSIRLRGLLQILADRKAAGVNGESPS